MDTNDRIDIYMQTGTAALSKGGGKIRNIAVAVEGEWDTDIRVSSDFPARTTFPQIISEIVRQSNIVAEGDEENWPAYTAAQTIDSIHRYGGCQHRGEFHSWDEVNGNIHGLEAKNV